MELTAGQAAKQAGCGKATISRALKTGDISSRKMPDGSYRINPAELQRWIAERSTRGGQVRTGTTPEPAPETLPLMVELAELRAKLDSANLERERERETLSAMIDDLRKQRDGWQEQAKAIMRLAPPSAASAPVSAEVEVEVMPGEFQRYTGNETFTPKPPPNPPRSEIATEGDRKPAERVGFFGWLRGRRTA